MWIVIEKISTERDSATKGEPQVYAAYSVWLDEASHSKAEAPIYQSDVLLPETMLPDTVTDFVRDAQGNLLLRRGGMWTQSEYAAECAAHHRKERGHPNADLATETVAVDIVQELKLKHILPHLERADAEGNLRGNGKGGQIREKEQPAPEDKAERQEFKDLIGNGFELLLEREKVVRAEKDKDKAK